METHLSAHTRFVDAGGVRFAHRRVGASAGVPLVLLQHFTGTMDAWDPLVVDGFGRERPVILVDNAGVGASGGDTPETVGEMADPILAFLAALGLARIDILGFSLGGMIAQLIAARRPELVRRMILAGTGPEGGEGIREMGGVVARGQRASPAEPRLALFFEPTESSQAAGRAFIKRQARRTEDRDPDTSPAAVRAQLAAITRWGESSAEDGAARLRGITQPVLVVNGKSDRMIPTPNSYMLFEQLPDARLLLFPDSGHGAIFQFAGEFVDAGLRFLDG
jgi:pimeloyl-ACP methyl ester carboxylesterase